MNALNFKYILFKNRGRVWGNGYWEIPIDKLEAIGTDGKSVASVCGPGSQVTDCRATFDTGAAVIGKSFDGIQLCWEKNHSFDS